MDEMRAYPWPGNVRELQNCIERAVILTEGDTIHSRHLSLSFRAPAPVAQARVDDGLWEQMDLSGTLADVTRRVVAEAERRKIDRTLKESGGNRAKAGDLLQVMPKVLAAKIKEYGLG